MGGGGWAVNTLPILLNKNLQTTPNHKRFPKKLVIVVVSRERN